MWAAYIVLSQRTGRAFAGLDGLALALVVSTAAVAPLGLTTIDRWTWQDVALGLGIAVLSSVLPYSLELVALRHLAQRVFGVLLSLEPAVAALAGFVVLSQVLDPAQIAGMALVVVASAIVLGSQARRSAARRGGAGHRGRADRSRPEDRSRADDLASTRCAPDEHATVPGDELGRRCSRRPCAPRRSGRWRSCRCTRSRRSP